MTPRYERRSRNGAKMIIIKKEFRRIKKSCHERATERWLLIIFCLFGCLLHIRGIFVSCLRVNINLVGNSMTIFFGWSSRHAKDFFFFLFFWINFRISFHLSNSLKRGLAPLFARKKSVCMCMMTHWLNRSIALRSREIKVLCGLHYIPLEYFLSFNTDCCRFYYQCD